MDNNYKFFRNVDCQYFPCHNAPDPERFNCLFCFCPFYLLGDQCGGSFQFIGPNKDIKDCSDCTLPHQSAYYDVIVKRLSDHHKG
ncbi:MAG: cysteine-rich small domain-containing protein [Clostridiaceae bacterium]